MLADIQRSVGRIQGALQHMAASLERREREHYSLARRVGKVEGKQAHRAGIVFSWCRRPKP
jgi:hypothetical protein